MADCANYFWDKVTGQDEALASLRTSLAADSLAHAYLFVGPAGLGKIHAARAVAATLMCAEGGCGDCAVCGRLKRNTHPDFQVLEPEGKQAWLVGQIRELTWQANLAPQEASHKVYVLRAAEALVGSAAAAFLKTLEEPPRDVTFVLLATSVEGVVPTIRSRCQVLR
ncbi:MAG: DNA polymerase III subunit delta, partial [Actinomycetes bacterium]|nr:DNA polymerase III subunit delta [Actinomycetes bacterium]